MTSLPVPAVVGIAIRMGKIFFDLLSFLFKSSLNFPSLLFSKLKALIIFAVSIALPPPMATMQS